MSLRSTKAGTKSTTEFPADFFKSLHRGDEEDALACLRAEAIPDGWFRTGDLAIMDEEGYFTIVDRKKDMILRGGMNVYPREVEEVIYQHPDVLEVAVVSVPDALLGEDVGAAVALRPGSTATPADIVAFTKERIAAYKYPRHVWFVSELPKGPTGKILRREVHTPAP